MLVPKSTSQSSKNATKRSKPVANKSRFNQKRLEQLASPASGRAYYYDALVRGLALAVSPQGKKTYLLYRKIDGRPERITIGPFCDLTVEQARNRAEELNSDIALGKNPAVRKRTIRTEATLQELFDTYLENHAKLHKRTWADDESTFNLYLSGLRFRKISSIRKSDVVALHQRIGRTRGKYTANRLVELLSSMFNRAREWGWEGENPAAGIKAFKEEKRERFMDGAELKLFFQSLAKEPNATMRDYLLVSLLTGARRSNVQAMRWPEINWELSSWQIPGEKAKAGESINLPLSPIVLRILENRKEHSKSEFVFPGVGRTKHLVEPKSAWKRLLKRAEEIEREEWTKANRGKSAQDFQGHDFSDLRLHDLRRTLGSWQAATGASLPIIGKSLGHSSLQATQIYARLNLDPVRLAVNKATSAMLEAGNATALLGDGQ